MGMQQMLLGSSGGLVAPVLVTHIAAGSGTDFIPPGAVSVTIEAWGPTWAGGTGTGTGCSILGGGGGGSSGYSRSFYLCSGGLTVSWFVGAAGTDVDSIVSSGTLSITTMVANNGNPGNNATGVANGTGGTGGTATGGNQANTTGTTGASGTSLSGGLGGAPITGVNASLGQFGGHGGRGSPQTGRTIGSDGGIAFYYQ